MQLCASVWPSASLAFVNVNQINELCSTQSTAQPSKQLSSRPNNSSTVMPVVIHVPSSSILKELADNARSTQHALRCTHRLGCLSYMPCRSEDHTRGFTWAACLWGTPDQRPPASPVPSAAWGSWPVMACGTRLTPRQLSEKPEGILPWRAQHQPPVPKSW